MKNTLGLIVIAGMVLCLGCNQKKAPSGETGKTPVIAFVMKTLTNPFFITMEQGVRQAEKEFGCKVIVQASEEETSIEQMVGIVDAMIAKKVNAICVTPSGSTEIIPSFTKAAQAGIPIIDVDVEIDKTAAQAAGLPYCYVGADNLEGGYLAGKYLAGKLGGKGKVAILEGIPGVDNAEKRKAGSLKAFSGFPNIKMVASQTAHWKTEEALNVFTNILQANPDLAGVFCANDMMAFGAINAIEAAGKKGKVLVASYDALDAAKTMISDGSMLCSIDQRPDLMGYNAVKFALDKINGKEVPQRFMVPLTNITKETLTQKAAPPTPAPAK
jgi:ribose transport system substrate-binding protein